MTDKETEQGSESDGGKLGLDLKHNSSCLKSIGQQVKLAVTAIAGKLFRSLYLSNIKISWMLVVNIQRILKFGLQRVKHFLFEGYCKFSVWNDTNYAICAFE